MRHARRSQFADERPPCACGCGEPVPIAKKTSSRYGHVKGQPTRFVAGHTSRRKPVLERLIARSKANGSCLEWQGSRLPKQYGVISVKEDDRIVRRYTHRVMWKESRGPIPDGMCILHRCDNPPCINIDHLFLGSVQDNIRDMWSKGRGVVPDPRKGQPRRKAVAA